MSLHATSLLSVSVILSFILASSDCSGRCMDAGTPVGLLKPRPGEVSSAGEAKEATSQDR